MIETLMIIFVVFMLGFIIWVTFDTFKMAEEYREIKTRVEEKKRNEIQKLKDDIEDLKKLIKE